MFLFQSQGKGDLKSSTLSCRRRNNYFSWPRANCKGEKKLSSHMQHIRVVQNPKRSTYTNGPSEFKMYPILQYNQIHIKSYLP